MKEERKKQKSWKGRRRLKGQFFLIAGLLLTIMFFIGLPQPPSLVQLPVVKDLQYAYENIEREFSHAINLGSNESTSVDTLKNFTLFTSDMLGARFISFDSLWIISEGNTSDIINVSVGNFLSAAVNVTLNMTDDGGTSVIKYLDVPKDGTNSTEFGSVTSEFNLTIAFNDNDQTVEWERDKANLYALINLTRGDSIKKEEFDF